MGLYFEKNPPKWLPWYPFQPRWHLKWIGVSRLERHTPSKPNLSKPTDDSRSLRRGYNGSSSACITFSILAQRIWNSLAVFIKDSPSSLILKNFKKVHKHKVSSIFFLCIMIDVADIVVLFPGFLIDNSYNWRIHVKEGEKKCKQKTRRN